MPGLAERWTTVEGVATFYRESAAGVGPVMTHLHGFGLSGRYLLPTAELLSRHFHTLVPDLPGFGRSGNAPRMADVPDLADAAARFLDAVDVASTTMVANSVGCAVVSEFSHLYPGRLDRAILVSPAGGRHNQPLPRAVGQLLLDAVREPPRILPVALPDYLRFGVPSTRRLFRSLTRYPALERLLQLEVPTLIVIGTRDPLMPHPDQIRATAHDYGQASTVVVLESAAHAINFSHPTELAGLIRRFMADEPLTDAEAASEKSHRPSRIVEIHRGHHAPPRASGT